MSWSFDDDGLVGRPSWAMIWENGHHHHHHWSVRGTRSENVRKVYYCHHHDVNDHDHDGERWRFGSVWFGPVSLNGYYPREAPTERTTDPTMHYYGILLVRLAQYPWPNWLGDYVCVLSVWVSQLATLTYDRMSYGWQDICDNHSNWALNNHDGGGNHGPGHDDHMAIFW